MTALRPSRLLVLASALLAGCAGLGGCGAKDQQRLSVTMEALPQNTPQAGVPIKVTTLNPQHALRPSDYTRWIGGGPASDGPARFTDDAGKVTILAPLDRPFLVQIILPGLQPETIFMRENDKGPFENTDWIEVPIGKPEAPRKWRVKIETGA